MAAQRKEASAPTADSPRLPAATLLAIMAGVAAAWIAAGSAGAIAAPLTAALFWIALGTAVAASWPRRGPAAQDVALLAVALAAAAWITASNFALLGVFAAAIVLAAMARLHSPPSSRAVLAAATAVFALAVFRTAYNSIPAVWHVVFALSHLLGRLAGAIAHRPLSIGPSFAAIDCLWLIVALAVAWLAFTKPPRLGRAIVAAGAILLAHFAYLILLARAEDLAAALPKVVLPEVSDMSRVGTWTWGNALRSLLPWNLPAVIVVVDTLIAGAMFRFFPGRTLAAPVPPGDGKAPAKPVPASDAKPQAADHPAGLVADALLRFGPALLAAAIPALVAYAVPPTDLKDRTVAVYDAGGLDWSNPGHSHKTPPYARTFGMLPAMVESLGGRLVRCRELSAADLKAASVLILLSPGKSAAHLSPAERDRVWEYVRGGGSLLVAGPTGASASRAYNDFGEVLAAAGMTISGAAITPIVKDWEEAVQAAPAAAAAGVDAGRNGFGLHQPVAVRVGWTAGPLLTARWAWSDSSGEASGETPRPDAAHPLLGRYAAGQPLGDLPVAAQGRLGRGRVVAIGDDAMLTNDGIPASHVFVARLLAWLASPAGGPQDAWRQAIGLLAAIALMVLLACRPDALQVFVAAGTMAVSLACCAGVGASAPVLPDGRSHRPNRLAYIDASHAEAYSRDAWGADGVGEFLRALRREGYLPLLLGAVDAERLDRAGLLILIAPGRAFSREEREAAADFVHHGGTLVSTVGAESIEASRDLLDEFGLSVPPAPTPPSDKGRETEPLGCFSQCYAEHGDRKAYVQFYAGWPVGGADIEPLVKWSIGKFSGSEESHEYPVVVKKQDGAGQVVLIGDSNFAMNKNMGFELGDLPENLAFWQWLLAPAARQENWVPPEQGPSDEPAENKMIDAEKESPSPSGRGPG